MTRSTGCVEVRTGRPFQDAEEFIQCLQQIAVGETEAAQIDLYETLLIEQIRERVEPFLAKSHVTPTVSSYYQAILSPGFCESVTASSIRRFTKVFRETVTSVE